MRQDAYYIKLILHTHNVVKGEYTTGWTGSGASKSDKKASTADCPFGYLN